MIGTYAIIARQEAISDTSRSWIYGPSAAITTIAEKAGGWYNSKYELYVIRCTEIYNDLPFSFIIDGRLYSIPSREYILDVCSASFINVL